MASGTSNTGNESSGNKKPLAHEGGHFCVDIIKSQIDVATRSRNYGSSQNVLGPEPPPRPETPL
jgi:hypothetical protein